MDRDLARNTLGISSVEFLWGLGIPVVLESTFLQLFLRNLGASSFQVGMVPTLVSVGLALVAPLSGTLTAPLQRKRPAVLATHVAAALPVLSLGVYLWVAGLTDATLGVFFAAYALFSVGVGMLWPVWQNYLVKIFAPSKAVAALGIMMTAQSAAKIISSLVILKIVDRYSFSAGGSALIFTLVGATFLVGSFMFLTTREPDTAAAGNRDSLDSSAGPPVPCPPRFARTLGLGVQEVMANRRFLLFLGAELEYCAVAGIVAFYANYATEFCGVSAAAASGLFVGSGYLGAITANALLGWLGLLRLRNKFLVTRLLSLAAIPLLCFSCSLTAFLIASFCFGASRGTRMAAFAPAVKQLSGRDDATHYFALAPLLVLPLSSGIPLAAGALIDRLASLGSWSYRTVFLGLGLLSLAGILFLLRVRFPGDPDPRQVGRYRWRP